MLGLHPGPQLTVPACASLAALTLSQTRAALRTLTRANLVTQQTPGRYSLHDLLRAYATELVQTQDSEEQRHAATGRMLEHYLHTARAACLLAGPASDLRTPPAARPPVLLEALADREQAVTWFTAERAVLVALARQSESAGFGAHTVQLAPAVATFLEYYGHWHDQTVVHEAALAAAVRLRDRPMQAYAHRVLGCAHFRWHRFEQAHTHYQRSLSLLGASGEPVDVAHSHYCIAFALQQLGRHEQALDHAGRALDLYRAAAHPRQSLILALIGVCHAGLGDYEEALARAKQALAVHGRASDPVGRAMAWWCLGQAHHGLGHHRQAIAWYRRLVDLHRAQGDRHFLAETLILLGEVHRDVYEPQSLRDAWQQALVILDELGHPDAEQLRTRLSGLDPQECGGPQEELPVLERAR